MSDEHTGFKLSTEFDGVYNGEASQYFSRTSWGGLPPTGLVVPREATGEKDE